MQIQNNHQTIKMEPIATPSAAVSETSQFMNKDVKLVETDSTAKTMSRTQDAEVGTKKDSIFNKLKAFLPTNQIKSFFCKSLFGNDKQRQTISQLTLNTIKYSIEDKTSEPVSIQGNAGELNGYYHSGTGENKSDKVVLFLHGSHSSCEKQSEKTWQAYQKDGIDVLTVNYRGFGKSEGSPTGEQDLYQDAESMLNHLVSERGIDPSNIIVHGYSLGGPVATHLAVVSEQQGSPLSGILLDRPMPSLEKGMVGNGMAKELSFLPKKAIGTMSINQMVESLSKDTSVTMLTDKEGLGGQGEILRQKLMDKGFDVKGEATNSYHEDPHMVGIHLAEIKANLF